MTGVARNPSNVCTGGFGAIYDLFIERPWLTSAFARVVWGVGVQPMYASLNTLADLPSGATILDAPCGGGLALRGMRRDRSLRYIGCDLSPEMIERTRRRTRDHKLLHVELICADIRDLPLDDQIADVCLCYNGLQLIPEPDIAVRELARCLRPGGAMLGSTLVSEGSLRQKAVLALQRRRGQVVPSGTAADLEDWLRGGGLVDISLAPDRGFVVFSARKAVKP